MTLHRVKDADQDRRKLRRATSPTELPASIREAS
jgi:hypothetical protein